MNLDNDRNEGLETNILNQNTVPNEVTIYGPVADEVGNTATTPPSSAAQMVVDAAGSSTNVTDNEEQRDLVPMLKKTLEKVLDEKVKEIEYSYCANTAHETANNGDPKPKCGGDPHFSRFMKDIKIPGSPRDKVNRICTFVISIWKCLVEKKPNKEGGGDKYKIYDPSGVYPLDTKKIKEWVKILDGLFEACDELDECILHNEIKNEKNDDVNSTFIFDQKRLLESFPPPRSEEHETFEKETWKKNCQEAEVDEELLSDLYEFCLGTTNKNIMEGKRSSIKQLCTHLYIMNMQENDADQTHGGDENAPGRDPLRLKPFQFSTCIKDYKGSQKRELVLGFYCRKYAVFGAKLRPQHNLRGKAKKLFEDLGFSNGGEWQKKGLLLLGFDSSNMDIEQHQTNGQSASQFSTTQELAPIQPQETAVMQAQTYAQDSGGGGGNGGVRRLINDTGGGAEQLESIPNVPRQSNVNRWNHNHAQEPEEDFMNWHSSSLVSRQTIPKIWPNNQDYGNGGTSSSTSSGNSSNHQMDDEEESATTNQRQDTVVQAMQAQNDVHSGGMTSPLSPQRQVISSNETGGAAEQYDEPQPNAIGQTNSNSMTDEEPDNASPEQIAERILKLDIESQKIILAAIKAEENRKRKTNWENNKDKRNRYDNHGGLGSPQPPDNTSRGIESLFSMLTVEEDTPVLLSKETSSNANKVEKDLRFLHLYRADPLFLNKVVELIEKAERKILTSSTSSDKVKNTTATGGVSGGTCGASGGSDTAKTMTSEPSPLDVWGETIKKLRRNIGYTAEKYSGLDDDTLLRYCQDYLITPKDMNRNMKELHEVISENHRNN